MAKLEVNLDTIARVRQIRQTIPLRLAEAVKIAEKAGADGIIAHLRQDRRHVQEHDLIDIVKTSKKRTNFELAATDKMINIALRIKPDTVTLVPERVNEITTEHGLNVIREEKTLAKFINKLKKAKIEISIFVDADAKQVQKSFKLGASKVEIYTGSYATAKTKGKRKKELERIIKALKEAKKLGLITKVGHDVDYNNIKELIKLNLIDEFSIGYSIMLRSMTAGLYSAVSEMKRLVA